MPIERRTDTSKPKRERTSKLGSAIALRIRRLRMARELTQMELEERAELSAGSISRLEGGERTFMPSSELVLRVAQVLGPEEVAGCVGWIITGKGSWVPPKLPRGVTLGRLKG